MKTKKTKLFVLFALVASLVVTMACLFTACGDEEDNKPTNFAITWTVPTDVTVAVDGADGTPETWAADTDLVFAVTAPTGYEATVKNGTTTLRAGDNGKYTVKVSKEVTIKITTSRILTGITVKENKKSFFEDEEVGKDDITVTATYAVGDPDVVTGWTVTYQNGSKFAAGDTKYTVSFGGQQKEITLASAVVAPITFTSAVLEVNEKNQPVLVAQGQYNAEGDVKAKVEAFVVDCMERGTWTKLSYTAEATANADKTFTFKLTITGQTKNGGQYYFHTKTGADGENFWAPMEHPTAAAGPSNDNITYEELGDPVVAANGAKYYYGNCENWGKVIMIIVVDENATTLKNVALEEKDGKPYAVFNGTCGDQTTQEDILNYLIHLDAEDIKNGNVKPNGESYVDENAIVNPDTISIVIDTAAKTFKVYVLLEGENVKDGAAFFFHLGAQGSDGYYPNVSLPGDETAKTITVNGLTFTFVTAADLGLGEAWQTSLLYVQVTTAA